MSEQIEKQSKKWYQKPILVIISILLFFSLTVASAILINQYISPQTRTGEVDMRCNGATITSKTVKFDKPLDNESSVILTVGNVNDPGFYNVSYKDVSKEGFTIYAYSIYDDDISISYVATEIE